MAQVVKVVQVLLVILHVAQALVAWLEALALKHVVQALVVEQLFWALDVDVVHVLQVLVMVFVAEAVVAVVPAQH